MMQQMHEILLRQRLGAGLDWVKGLEERRKRTASSTVRLSSMFKKSPRNSGFNFRNVPGLFRRPNVIL